MNAQVFVLAKIMHTYIFLLYTHSELNQTRIKLEKQRTQKRNLKREREKKKKDNFFSKLKKQKKRRRDTPK